MTDLAGEALAEHLEQLETLLLLPHVRENPVQAGHLLTEDFREFGSSGQVFDRPQVLALLAGEQGGGEVPPRLTLTDFRCHRLGNDVALVTYRSHRQTVDGTVSSLRSSVWVRAQGAWRMHFHQGTKQ